MKNEYFPYFNQGYFFFVGCRRPRRRRFLGPVHTYPEYALRPHLSGEGRSKFRKFSNALT